MYLTEILSLCHTVNIGPDMIYMYVFVMVPDSRINSWESFFIFNLGKINTNQHYESDSLNAGDCNALREYKILQDDKTHDNYCTYLNSRLLEAPREYVLYGLVPGIKLSPVLASPYKHASCCHAQLGILLFIATVQVSHLAPSAIWVASH